jgi:hypothetical protein
MSDPQPQLPRSLDEQRAEYARRRGLAMPLAGVIVWTLIGIAGAFRELVFRRQICVLDVCPTEAVPETPSPGTPYPGPSH